MKIMHLQNLKLCKHRTDKKKQMLEHFGTLKILSNKNHQWLHLLGGRVIKLEKMQQC